MRIETDSEFECIYTNVTEILNSKNFWYHFIKYFLNANLCFMYLKKERDQKVIKAMHQWDLLFGPEAASSLRACIVLLPWLQ